jgi:hypothetical protein
MLTTKLAKPLMWQGHALPSIEDLQYSDPTTYYGMVTYHSTKNTKNSELRLV